MSEVGAAVCGLFERGSAEVYAVFAQVIIEVSSDEGSRTRVTARHGSRHLTPWPPKDEGAAVRDSDTPSGRAGPRPATDRGREMKRLRSPLLPAVTAVLLLGVTVACGADEPAAAPPPAPPEPAPAAPAAPELLVGYVLPSTGSLAYLVGPVFNGIEMALAEINAAGHGTVRLLPGDSGTDPVIANRTVDDHLAEGVSAILGAAASGISLSIIDKVVGAGVVQMSPVNTSPSLTTYDDKGHYFRTIPPDRLHAQALGDFMTDEGITAAAILYRADDWGRNLADDLAARLDANGVAVAASIAYDPEGTAFDAELQQILGSGADGTVLLAFDEGVAILQGMIEAGIGPGDLPMFIPNGLAGSNLWEAVDPNNPAVLLGAVGTFVAEVPTGGEASFPQRYAEFAPGADILYAATSYDSLIVLALASLVAGSTDAADYVGEINDVTRGGTKCDRYADCAALIADGVDIDYDGAAGPLDFTDVGEPGVGSYDTYRFDEQGQVVVMDQVVVGGN